MRNIKIEDLIEEYDNLEGRLILSHLMNLNYTALMLILRENASEKIVNEFREIVKRRKNGEPLQYILGIWNFYGREFYVGREVLIPRPETEILVEKVLGYVEDGMEILDIGSGTGIISVTIAKEKPKTQVYGVDVSQQAYDMSKRNAVKLGVKNVNYESCGRRCPDEGFPGRRPRGQSPRSQKRFPVVPYVLSLSFRAADCQFIPAAVENFHA